MDEWLWMDGGINKWCIINRAPPKSYQSAERKPVVTADPWSIVATGGEKEEQRGEAFTAEALPKEE